MNIIEKILYALQFEIERPSSYGLFHFACIAISITILIVLVKRKEKDHEKALKRILLVYGVGALTLELLKQIIWSFNYDPTLNTVTWDYQWYAFPFQLCTTPMFVSIICAFLKDGKVRNSLLSYMAFTTILGSLATAIYPEACFVRTLLIDIHTMYLHLGSLVVSLYLLIKHDVDIKFKNLINGYYVFLLFAFIAEIMNIIIYKSGIIGDETFNMFYISPYFTSSLPLFDTIQNKTPFLLFLFIYLFAIFIGSLVVWSIAKLINKLKKNKKSRK